MTGLMAGKVCLVTGGGSGIGRATVLEMLCEGAETVIAADLSLGAAEATARIAQEGDGFAGTVDPVRVDVTDSHAVAALMDHVAERYGCLDVLHNNAGVVEAQFTSDPWLESCPEAAWDAVFNVNVKGAWLCAKHAIPLLRRSAAGAIVNCASVSGHTAVAGEAVYGASKAAVVQLTRSLAAEFAADGIRANCYSPAAVDTPMTRAENTDASAIDRLTSRYLVKRLATPNDVASLVCFLASEKAAFINGTVVAIDGGMLAWPGRRSKVE